MPIDPSYGARYRGLEELLSGPHTEQEVRERLRQIAQSQEPWTSPDVTIEDISIAGPHGPIPARTYRPARGRPARALLWAHGGGFQGGDLDMHEAHMVSGELARRANAFVVSVGYRLARDGVRYPVPLDDVHAAWSWLCAQGLTAAGLRDAPAALGGASAGATLALGAELRDRDNGLAAADALLLAYPFAHFPVPALDEATAAELSVLSALGRFTPLGIEEIVRNYVGRISDLPTDALPGAASLEDLPPTHILLSEYDDLRPSGELLRRQLEEAQVPVATYLAKGMLHGHLNISELLPEVEGSLDFFADALCGAQVLK